MVAIEDQRSDLSQVQEVIPLLAGHLRLVVFICNQTWSYGYIEGLKRMGDHLLENP